MTLDTKNLNESQLAEIQKHIDELAATNKQELPLHLRMPKVGEGYYVIADDGYVITCYWDNSILDHARRAEQGHLPDTNGRRKKPATSGTDVITTR